MERNPQTLAQIVKAENEAILRVRQQEITNADKKALLIEKGKEQEKSKARTREILSELQIKRKELLAIDSGIRILNDANRKAQEVARQSKVEFGLMQSSVKKLEHFFTGTSDESRDVRDSLTRKGITSVDSLLKTKDPVGEASEVRSVKEMIEKRAPVREKLRDAVTARKSAKSEAIAVMLGDQEGSTGTFANISSGIIELNATKVSEVKSLEAEIFKVIEPRVQRDLGSIIKELHLKNNQFCKGLESEEVYRKDIYRIFAEIKEKNIFEAEDFSLGESRTDFFKELYMEEFHRLFSESIVPPQISIIDKELSTLHELPQDISEVAYDLSKRTKNPKGIFYGDPDKDTSLEPVTVDELILSILKEDNAVRKSNGYQMLSIANFDNSLNRYNDFLSKSLRQIRKIEPYVIHEINLNWSELKLKTYLKDNDIPSLFKKIEQGENQYQNANEKLAIIRSKINSLDKKGGTKIIATQNEGQVLVSPTALQEVEKKLDEYVMQLNSTIIEIQDGGKNSNSLKEELMSMNFFDKLLQGGKKKDLESKINESNNDREVLSKKLKRIQDESNNLKKISEEIRSEFMPTSKLLYDILLTDSWCMKALESKVGTIKTISDITKMLYDGLTSQQEAIDKTPKGPSLLSKNERRIYDEHERLQENVKQTNRLQPF